MIVQWVIQKIVQFNEDDIARFLEVHKYNMAKMVQLGYTW